jgi:hypothetical protein
MAPVCHTLGDYLDRLFLALALSTGQPMQHVMDGAADVTGYSVATVYRWRQNRLRPSDKALTQLALLAKTQAGLPRAWGEGFLRHARHPSPSEILDKVWGIRHNLPRAARWPLIGRADALTSLLNTVSAARPPRVLGVTGLGGVGKTALALEAARYCESLHAARTPDTGFTLEESPFDAIVFAPVKGEVCTPHGVTTHSFYSTRHQIMELIAEVSLGSSDGRPLRAASLVEDQLAQKLILLVLDGLDGTNPYERLDLLWFLQTLPESVTIIVTSREALPFPGVQLQGLDDAATVQLVLTFAAENGLALDEESAIMLGRRACGIPAVIALAVASLQMGYSTDNVVQSEGSSWANIMGVVLGDTISPLRRTLKHDILMALSLFPGPVSLKLVATAIGVDQTSPVFVDAIAHLRSLSLLTGESKVCLVQPAQDFMRSELLSDSQFVLDATSRVRKATDAEGGFFARLEDICSNLPTLLFLT